MSNRKVVLLVLMFAFLVVTAGIGQVPQGPSAAQPAATQGQVFMGPVGGNATAFTRILITNKDANQEECFVGVFFHQGSTIATQLPEINGVQTEFVRENIPRGGIRWFDLRAQALIQGSVTVFTEDPCTPDSVSVQGNYFIAKFEQPQSGIDESFTIRANDSNTWLKDKRCLVVSTKEGRDETGIGQSLGIAVSSVNPGQPAPQGTELEIMVFSQEGQLISSFTRTVTGQHETFFPGDSLKGLSGKVSFIFCLSSSDPEYTLDFSGVRVDERPSGFEFGAPIFADGFESGDVSAWSTGSQ